MHDKLHNRNDQPLPGGPTIARLTPRLAPRASARNTSWPKVATSSPLFLKNHRGRHTGDWLKKAFVGPKCHENNGNCGICKILVWKLL